MTDPAVRIDLRAVLYREGALWIAHCLELDIVAQGDTTAAALAQLAELCGAQVHAAIEDADLQSAFHAAPPEVWALYSRAAPAVLVPRLQPQTPINRFEYRELRSA